MSVLDSTAIIMRQQPKLGHIINMLTFNGEIVHPLGAGELAAIDDGERAGAAADYLVVMHLLGRDPVAAGLAVELVQAGGSELFAVSGGAHGGELPDVVVGERKGDAALF